MQKHIITVGMLIMIQGIKIKPAKIGKNHIHLAILKQKIYYTTIVNKIKSKYFIHLTNIGERNENQRRIICNGKFLL